MRFLLGCALAAALLWWLLQGVDTASALRQVQALPALLWGLGPLGLVASYGLRAARVRSELQHLQPVRWASAWQVTLVHNAAVNLLPMRGGELAYPYLVHKKLGIAPAQSLASLLWMRLQDLLVLCALALLLLLPLALPLRLLLALGFAALVALGLRWARGRVTRAPRPGESGLAKPKAANALADETAAPAKAWRIRLRRLLQSTRPVLLALADGPRHSRASWLYCIANWALKLLVIGSVLQAAAALPWPLALQGALGGELAALLPLQGPSGLGTYEAGVWGAVALAQTPTAALPVAALLAHGFIFATALLAGLLAGGQMLLGHNSAPKSS
ncbi:MAG: lysylphosphatidylglycerol synthase domain-containing protein [Burkholderiaceae bacterium]